MRPPARIHRHDMPRSTAAAGAMPILFPASLSKTRFRD
jgi:hypothetical protein